MAFDEKEAERNNKKDKIVVDDVEYSDRFKNPYSVDIGTIVENLSTTKNLHTKMLKVNNGGLNESEISNGCIEFGQKYIENSNSKYSYSIQIKSCAMVPDTTDELECEIYVNIHSKNGMVLASNASIKLQILIEKMEKELIVNAQMLVPKSNQKQQQEESLAELIYCVVSSAVQR